tara:strand:- start:156 stop:377 length:222 start_codon:yes stop_codon:yes gene_type:complete
MTAVCDLFLAPKGIASGGGHGSSVAIFDMSRGLLGGLDTLSGCFDSAGFSSASVLGTGAALCECLLGVKFSGS